MEREINREAGGGSEAERAAETKREMCGEGRGTDAEGTAGAREAEGVISRGPPKDSGLISSTFHGGSAGPSVQDPPTEWGWDGGRGKSGRTSWKRQLVTGAGRGSEQSGGWADRDAQVSRLGTSLEDCKWRGVTSSLWPRPALCTWQEQGPRLNPSRKGQWC